MKITIGSLVTHCYHNQSITKSCIGVYLSNAEIRLGLIHCYLIKSGLLSGITLLGRCHAGHMMLTEHGCPLPHVRLPLGCEYDITTFI